MKTEVYALGRELGVPQSILNAKPTDGLWGDDRSDEDQLGASYPELEWAMEFDGDETTLNERQAEVLAIYLFVLCWGSSSSCSAGLLRRLLQVLFVVCWGSSSSSSAGPLLRMLGVLFVVCWKSSLSSSAVPLRRLLGVLFVVWWGSSSSSSAAGPLPRLLKGKDMLG